MRRLIQSSGNALYLFAALCFTGMCADAATPLIDFPIGYSSNGGTYGFIGLIQQQHLLEQQGIRAQFVYIGGPQITQAFVAGDVQMMIVAAASPIRAAAQGAEVKFVGGVMDKEVLTLITSPAIKSPADMKGAKLAIDRLGTLVLTGIRYRYLLAKFVRSQIDNYVKQLGPRGIIGNCPVHTAATSGIVSIDDVVDDFCSRRIDNPNAATLGTRREAGRGIITDYVCSNFCVCCGEKRNSCSAG